MLSVLYEKCPEVSSLCDLLFCRCERFPPVFWSGRCVWSLSLPVWSAELVTFILLISHLNLWLGALDVISVMALTLNRLKLYVSVSVWVRLEWEGACRGPRWVPPSPDVWMAFVMRSFCSCVFSLLLCVLYPTHNELSVSRWHPTRQKRKCLTDPAGTSSHSTSSENTWCVIYFHVFDVKLHGVFSHKQRCFLVP